MNNKIPLRKEQCRLRWHVAPFAVTADDVPLSPTSGNPWEQEGRVSPVIQCIFSRPYFLSAEVNQAKRNLTGCQSSSLDGA